MKYAVVKFGDQWSQVITLENAVQYAKDYAAKGYEVAVYKLVETHYFAPERPK